MDAGTCRAGHPMYHLDPMLLQRNLHFYQVGMECQILKKDFWKITLNQKMGILSAQRFHYCLIFLTIYFEIKVRVHFSHQSLCSGGKNGL